MRASCVVSWIMAWIGILVPAPEVVNNAAFIVIFPLTFASSANAADTVTISGRAYSFNHMSTYLEGATIKPGMAVSTRHSSSEASSISTS